MIVSRTPFRMSFFGGGTDYPDWYRKNGGAVLATTINKYCYISCRYLPPFFEHKHRIVYSTAELAMSVDEIKHPSVRECLKYTGISDGMEIHHDGDLPARTGLGSSSAFTVGLLHALHALKGNMLSKMALAREAIHVEHDIIHENVGSQDQIMTTFGGLKRIDFSPDDHFHVTPVTISPTRLQSLQQQMLLVYSGITRTASEVAAEYVNSTMHRRTDLKEIMAMVDTALQILSGDGSLDAFGDLLHESWLLKRGLTPNISNPEIDGIYNAARGAGALGGKLLGAGGGGFLVLFAAPEHHEAIAATLTSRLIVPFEFEDSGSQIIYYDPKS